MSDYTYPSSSRSFSAVILSACVLGLAFAHPEPISILRSVEIEKAELYPRSSETDLGYHYPRDNSNVCPTGYSLNSAYCDCINRIAFVCLNSRGNFQNVFYDCPVGTQCVDYMSTNGQMAACLPQNSYTYFPTNPKDPPDAAQCTTVDARPNGQKALQLVFMSLNNTCQRVANTPDLATIAYAGGNPFQVFQKSQMATGAWVSNSFFGGSILTACISTVTPLYLIMALRPAISGTAEYESELVQ